MAIPWYKYDNPFERKLAFDRLKDLPTPLTDLLLELNGSRFVSFLERLTGIPGLQPDPTFRGGGLHCIPPGGQLDIHADFNIHPISGLYRRINVIVFLNRGWRPEYNGCLEFWPADMRAPSIRIEPVFNRMVIFSISDTAYHGHPDPLATPDGICRKSLAWYYYSAEPPPGSTTDMHSTLYQRRPGDPLDPDIERLRQIRARGRLVDLRVIPTAG